MSIVKCPECNNDVSDNSAACPKCGYKINSIYDKDKNVAGILAIFFGGVGIHKFYLGKTGQGFIYLIFCWTLIPTIISFFEGVIYLSSSQEDFLNNIKDEKIKDEKLTKEEEKNFFKGMKEELNRKEILLHIRSDDNFLDVNDEFILIRKNILSSKKKMEKIPLCQIEKIQILKPEFFSKGSIKIFFISDNKTKNIKVEFSSENNFVKSQEIKKYIEERKQEFVEQKLSQKEREENKTFEEKNNSEIELKNEDIIGEIEKLVELKKQGFLTDEEFANAKKKLFL